MTDHPVEDDALDWTGARSVREAWNRSPLLASVRAAREHTPGSTQEIPDA